MKFNKSSYIKANAVGNTYGREDTFNAYVVIRKMTETFHRMEDYMNGDIDETKMREVMEAVKADMPHIITS